MVMSVQTNFEKSKKILIKYLKLNEENPTEKQWDQYALVANCLSSKTMGYIYGNGFSQMCKDLRRRFK